jgi:hypothetical protein
MPLCQGWIQRGYLDENNDYQYEFYPASCYNGSYCQIVIQDCLDYENLDDDGNPTYKPDQ